MKILITDINMFEDLLGQAGNHYDLHNDYLLAQISIEKTELVFCFQSDKEQGYVYLSFFDTSIVKLKIDLSKTTELLTIDTLYRGRYLFDNELIDLDDLGRGYIYIEFYDGSKIEFFCKYYSVVSGHTSFK